ncbi:MAG: hypothetical protein RLZZ479_255 [Bacteroidota bacterium]|jgi:hypothetical protein
MEVKRFDDFIKEKDTSKTKNAVSEKCWEALKNCYESALNEMKEYHNSKDKEEIAEKWLGEYANLNEAMISELAKECESMMKSAR